MTSLFRPWVEQQAQNFVYELAERGEKANYLIKDGDTKFTEKIDRVFIGEGIKVKRLPPESPHLNAFAERFVQSIKNECLDQFVVFAERPSPCTPLFKLILCFFGDVSSDLE